MIASEKVEKPEKVQGPCSQSRQSQQRSGQSRNKRGHYVESQDKEKRHSRRELLFGLHVMERSRKMRTEYNLAIQI